MPHLALLLSAALAPQVADVTTRVSVDSNEVQTMHFSTEARVSGDGRMVAFVGFDPGLAPGDGNTVEDVFVRDRLLGTTVRASVSNTGAGADLVADSPAISRDGRYVAFASWATNLVNLPTQDERQVYLRDLVLGTTEVVSMGASGTPGTQESGWPAVSADGNVVAFRSYSFDLVPNDVNFRSDIFVVDRALGTIEFASVSTSGEQALHHSYETAVSADGRYVVYSSWAWNLVPGDLNWSQDVFLRDRLLGTTELVSLGPGGVQANASSYGTLAVSDDGRWVAFESEATNLAPGAVTGTGVFVRDRLLGTTELVSLDSSGTSLAYAEDPTLSADGRWVGFHDGQAGKAWVRDRWNGVSRRLDHASDGAGGSGASWAVSLSADGSVAAWSSSSPNLVADDTNAAPDVFARELAATGADLTFPGLAAGATGTLTIQGATPLGAVVVGWSVSGPGPVASPFGLVDLAPPVATFPLPTDAAGGASVALSVPAALQGWPLWVQAVDVLTGELSTTLGGPIP